MKNANIKVLCQTAILIAVYVLLSMTLVIRTGNWKLTFVALPVIIASLSLGTSSGCAVALIGEFLSQMLTFGLMHTTIIWIWPPMGWALAVGFVAQREKRCGKHLEDRPVRCYAACIAGALITGCMNTLALWLDSLINHYYTFAVVFGSVIFRLPKDIITAFVVAAISIPLVKLLRRSGLSALQEAKNR